MADERTLARLDALIWILVYGGLLAAVLGMASLSSAPAAGWSLIVVGSLVALAGFVLIAVRARLQQPGPGGAESKQPRRPPE